MHDEEGCPYVIGLTSYGPQWCGTTGTFGVYTRLSAHYSWIRHYVPSVKVPVRPFDRHSAEARQKAVWNSMRRIEQAASAGGAVMRATVDLCEFSVSKVCKPMVARPLKDDESFLIRTAARSGERLVVFTLSSQGVLTQFRPSYASDAPSAGDVLVEARANWSLDGGRIVVIAVPQGVALPAVDDVAENTNGAIVDRRAWLAEIVAVANHPASRIGVMTPRVFQHNPPR